MVLVRLVKAASSKKSVQTKEVSPLCASNFHSPTAHICRTEEHNHIYHVYFVFEADVKWAINIAEFRNVFKPFVTDCTYNGWQENVDLKRVKS